MTYITTHHQFIIDDKHPTDVFDEMSNFFSLYTITLDSLNRLSIQLTVPADFDIDNNAKIHNAYQQFIKAVRYTIPDVNVLPPEPTQENESVIGLMIQHYDGVVVSERVSEESTAKPSFYQKMLGVFLPKYDETHEATGLYPERVTPTMLQPSIQPQPVPQVQPTPQPVPQPAPVPQPVTSPDPQIVPQVQPQPSSPTPVQPRPVVQPVTPTPSSTTQPQVPTQLQSPTQQLLPKPNLSIKPYRELLTQAIIQQAQQDKATQNTQNIRKITLKSRDSLTTALIETLFNSFDKSTPQGQGRAYDAIDLVSYGLEELRPKLASLGINLAEDTQFLLNAKAKATPTDLQRLANGQIAPSEIQLGAMLEYSDAVAQNNMANQPISPVPPVTPAPPNPTASPANANLLNIAINIKISDSMGERTVKVREFPVVFSTHNTPSQPAKLIKIMSQQAIGEMFYLTEQDGQLLAQNVAQNLAQNISLQRGGNVKSLQNNEVLLPNDRLQIGNEVQVLLSVN